MRTYEIKTENGKEVVYYYFNGAEQSKEMAFPEVIERLTKAGYININAPKWTTMLNDLLTPGGAIITRMRATAKATLNMSVEFSTVLIVLQNGANGFPDEATLQTLLRMNWGFTNGEKTTINTYLTNNKFNISVI